MVNTQTNLYCKVFFFKFLTALSNMSSKLSEIIQASIYEKYKKKFNASIILNLGKKKVTGWKGTKK